MLHWHQPLTSVSSCWTTCSNWSMNKLDVISAPPTLSQSIIEEEIKYARTSLLMIITAAEAIDFSLPVSFPIKMYMDPPISVCRYLQTCLLKKAKYLFFLRLLSISTSNYVSENIRHVAKANCVRY